MREAVTFEDAIRIEVRPQSLSSASANQRST
jgi:hypothetical protein